MTAKRAGSGVRGVYLDRASGKWIACCWYRGRRAWLGMHARFEDAVAVAESRRRSLKDYKQAKLAFKRWNDERVASGLGRVYLLAANDQLRAYQGVARAIKRGELKRQPCEECGRRSKVHAHHIDYLRPLDIQWMCAPCHLRGHRLGTLSRFGCDKASPHPIAEPQERAVWLGEALRILPEKQRALIELRVLRGATLQACGDAFGFTRQRAEQIEKQAMGLLRAWVANHGLMPSGLPPAGRIAPTLAAESEAA